ncbi:hypothetical protein AcW1_008900 [Taiwanofungus camphoratus]|nr:hypothetical protein AcW1_008900 [Antrodia cinnamomea]KAI0958957.1 hypothetical protein AcV7_004629 [Antrodia cinnamomea]
MPVFIAKKLCPDLILVENHFHRYMEMSKRVMDIFRQYDPTMCAAGCDEGYLNITIYCEDRQLTAEECVQEMRETVHKETRLTVSAGIAPNKMLAKICSDKNKPNGQFKLDFEPGAIRAFMKDLSIRKVPGVGRVNERLLDSIGIKTCGDIYTHRAILSLMDKHFGLHFLLQAYLGIASNIVQPGQREERKSIGAERTFTPIADKDRILQKLEEVAAELESDMINGGWTGKTVTLKYKLDTYQVFTRAKSFDKWISTKKEDLFTMGKELLTPELPLTLRLIGLRVTKLKDLRVQPKLSGIERFFEFSTSPTKKRRVEVDYVPLHEDQASLAQDGYQDAMPGYFEHAELDDEVGASLDLLNDIQDRNDIAPNDEVITLDVETSPSSEQGSTQTLERERQRPPNSAPLPSSGSASTSRPLKPISSLAKTPQGLHHTSMGSSSERNMRSANRRSPSHPTEGKSADRAGAVEAQTCPICEKLIETDNQGFNTHIDFCLSKKAIREAQASASVPMQQSPLSVKGTPARKKFVGREVATRKKRKR